MPRQKARRDEGNLGVLSAVHPQLSSIYCVRERADEYVHRIMPLLEAAAALAKHWAPTVRAGGRRLVPCPPLLAVCLSPMSPGLHLFVYVACALVVIGIRSRSQIGEIAQGTVVSIWHGRAALGMRKEKRRKRKKKLSSRHGYLLT